MEQLDQHGSGRGNTESPARISDYEVKSQNGSIDPMDQRKPRGSMTKYWVFTWNNYTQIDIPPFTIILDNECEWYLFQEETGENGTPHLQGTICLKKKQRLSALKKWVASIHWEPTKAIKASLLYSSKIATRSGKVYAKNIDIPPEIKVQQPRGWQLEVMEIIQNEPDDRTIHWFWERNGNVGKTSLCKFLVVKHNALMLTGKSNDMYHAINNNPTKRQLILVDVPRSSQDYINYGAIEQIKNGLVFSGKYDSCQLVFNCPHIIVFANEPPNYAKLSKDRWHIVEIKIE